MSSFLKLFWAIFLSAAALVGAWAAAVDLKHPGYFLACAVVAAAIASVVTMSKGVRPWLRRVRDYPKLLTRVAELEQENIKLTSNLSEVEKLIKERWQNGVREGRAEVIGAVFGATMRKVPKLSAVSFHGGRALLIADYEPPHAPSVGTRFAVQVVKTGERRGVVQVQTVSEDPPQAWLECVLRDSTSFWEHLAEVAQYDSAVPSDVELAKISVDHSQIPAPEQLELLKAAGNASEAS